MKSLLKYASLLTMMVVTLTLTACGRQSFDLTLEEGDGVIIETDNIQITQQTLFELVATHTTGGLNVSVSAILDWADEIILSELVEVDENQMTEEIEMLQEQLDDEQLEMLLLTEGFADLEAYAANTRLSSLRQQALANTIDITEEDILEVYHEWFGQAEVESDDTPELEADEETSDVSNSEENEADEMTNSEEDEADEVADSEEDETDEMTDSEEDEADHEVDSEEQETTGDVPELEEVRDDIKNWLIEQATQEPGFEQEVLANIRHEAGLVIHNNYLTDRYEDFLAAQGVTDANVNPSSNHEGAVATVGEHVLTVDELFDIIVARFALTGASPVLAYIDLQILDEVFDANHDVVRENISQAKVNMLDWFYPQMEAMGLTTERQIFDFFLFQHLQELAFEANFEPDEARVQELYENYVPPRGVHHILTDTYEEAEDLIAQLQEVDEADFADVFADLASQHSTDPSAEFNNGFLGALTLPSGMVEAFEVAAFALAEGEFTQTPVETEFGYHLIFVDEVETTLTLDEHRENEIQRLRMSPQYFTNFIIGLRAERHLVFHDPQLQAQYEAIVRQNEQLMEASE